MQICSRDRNWLEFLSVLDATVLYDAASHGEENTADSATIECSQRIQRTRELFIGIANEDGQKDRSGLLALLELEKRARARGLSASMSIYPAHSCRVTINHTHARYGRDG